jgi:hypothetical protein
MGLSAFSPILRRGTIQPVLGSCQDRARSVIPPTHVIRAKRGSCAPDVSTERGIICFCVLPLVFAFSPPLSIFTFLVSSLRASQRVSMGKEVTTMDSFSWFSGQGPVAAVNPADLRSVWDMQRDVQRNAPNRAPNEATAMSFGLYQRACSPEAEVEAVRYRVSILQLLAGPIGCSPPGCTTGNSPMPYSTLPQPSP